MQTLVPVQEAPLRPTLSAPRRARRGAEARSAYLYLSPTVVVMAVMMALPVLLVLYYSTQSSAVTGRNPRFVGLQNYAQLLSDPTFRLAVGNTVVFTVVSVALHLLVGLAFALMLNSTALPRWVLSVFRTVFILPWVMTAAIVAVLWQLMLNPNGVVNYVLQSAGLVSAKVEWLSDPALALGTVTFVNVWAGYPFFMISILAGLQGIPSDLYEAAKVDGARAFARLRHIVLPQLRPILLSMAMLDLIWNLQQFALVWLTTGGGPINATETIGTYTYKLAFSKYEFALAATAGSLLFLACVVVAVFYVRKQRSVS